MAKHWTSYIWKHRRDLRGPELLCALALAHLSDRDGICSPGLEKLAREMRVSVRHVQALISRLERKDVVRIRLGWGRGKLSVFHLIKSKGRSTSPPIKAVQSIVLPEVRKDEGTTIVHPDPTPDFGSTGTESNWWDEA